MCGHIGHYPCEKGCGAMFSAPTHPVRIKATLDPRLSRWKWPAKWILAIPHYIALIFLQVALLLLSIVAFFSILITGRYPRALFRFNVGAIRWNMRVSPSAWPRRRSAARSSPRAACTRPVCEATSALVAGSIAFAAATPRRPSASSGRPR
ncbi:DUF4389 domain-containing protein [Streptomyces sp. NPDC040724]|uniref:DUF4389 domain-containing protein n=1 Tax=Streptomyces sp. NPDC040724 TaxID=3155612 RepID=UPI0033D465D9